MTFAIDDSDVTISGRNHIILAAVGVASAALSEFEDQITKMKLAFGLSPWDEIKWNGMTVPLSRELRESLSRALLEKLTRPLVLVTVMEGYDKHRAAELISEQVLDYLADQPGTTDKSIELLFDNGILKDEIAFGQFLQKSNQMCVEPVNFRTVHSHESGLIQLADILAGFNNKLISLSAAHPERQVMRWVDVSEGYVETDLAWYVTAMLRHNTWGEIARPPESNNYEFDGSWPFKDPAGRGFRLHTSLDREVINRICEPRRVYMGCLR